ncbi:hypothetical protein LBW89_24915 [Paenibacillus sp. alder61]|uniref:hypothetical protein n=1 Tax=Paenibacillus sp. alder61 TaxID=2862948 RepID=UPI001CD22B0A|nr:hypothetical protein [Paenibacillus sp. alder61]MCA1296256.1 hypothetical protein [Paenibacillus sp. alder61]
MGGMKMRNSLILPDRPLLDSRDVSRIREDYERFREGLPERIETYLLETYGLDVTARYGLRAIRNPFGKASGQLSLNVRQVQEDCRARLGFVVLKTVIAEDADGRRSMEEWAVKETRMMVGKITGKETGETGWNVTWQGRGWHGSFGDYLAFFRKALDIGREHGTVIVPSCKYHLPGGEAEEFRQEEYEYTTRRLHGVWRESGAEGPLQMEKDFSPTLAGSGRARQQCAVLRWLREVPVKIKSSLPPGEIVLGIKLMNSMFADEFQIGALRTLIEGSFTPPDYIIYANRLYDQTREFAGKIGAAYGGPDLSRRNLRMLTLLRKLELAEGLARPIPPLSGTGNVCTGKMALEYALRGVKSLQMHTIFQKPAGAYGMRKGAKTERALHDLYFHPEHGLVPWMLHLRHAEEIRNPEGVTSFMDITEWYRDRGKNWFLKHEGK